MTNITNFIFEADDGAALGFRSVTIDGEPWFVAADALALLTLDRKGLERLDDDEKGVSSIHTLGGTQQMTIINESGLYSLILGSRKPEAKRFKKWITAEVLPSIRKTGTYIGPDAQLPPAHVPSLFLSHTADIMVAADRTFRSVLRIGRSTGMSQPQALRHANRLTLLKTGVDLLSELQAHDHIDAMEANAQPQGGKRPPWGGSPQDQAALQFWAEYEGGGLQGASGLPLLSTQAHALYRHWCRQQGFEPLPLTQMIAVLNRSGRARHIRKRYATATGEVQGPAAFLVPGGHIDAPAHMGETQYLGQCVAAVQAMVAATHQRAA